MQNDVEHISSLADEIISKGDHTRKLNALLRHLDWEESDYRAFSLFLENKLPDYTGFENPTELFIAILEDAEAYLDEVYDAINSHDPSHGLDTSSLREAVYG